MTLPDTNRLFSVLDATWPPARFVKAGPWLLREGRSGGQRVSSATTAGSVTKNDITLAETRMRSLSQRALFMIRRGERDLDVWLAARYYEVVDPVTLYIAPAADMAGTLPMNCALPTWPPLAIQRELWAAGGVGPARVAVMERAAGPKTSILGRHSDTPGGTAFVASDGDVAMLHALEVAPSERRKGVGETIMKVAANWAVENYATWLALAVTAANDPANGLYQKLGMRKITSYHYRRAPEGCP